MGVHGVTRSRGGAELLFSLKESKHASHTTTTPPPVVLRGSHKENPQHLTRFPPLNIIVTIVTRPPLRLTRIRPHCASRFREPGEALLGASIREAKLPNEVLTGKFSGPDPAYKANAAEYACFSAQLSLRA